MVAVWQIYHVENCQYTIPVKDKYIAVVCFNPNPHGFLINSKICLYVQKRPELLACQVKINADKYGFLGHDSYIDCSNILSFKGSELSSIQKIQNSTRKEIKKVVSTTKLIAPIYKKLICGETD